MNAGAVRCEPEQLRLWAGSAIAALLVHLMPAALLFLYLHWPPQPSLAGSRAALDVELASPPPAAAAPAASSPQTQPEPQPQTRQPLARLPPLVTVKSVQPLSQMRPIPQPDAAPSSTAPATPATAMSAPVESSDLNARGAPDPGLQLWEDELVALLASYKEYPRSAIKQMQQDSVKLHISVDPTGQVTYAQIDSTRHYRALEQEVQRMLRLAGRLPAPPPELSNDTVVTVPVQFSLIQRKAAPTRPTLASCAAAASPGPAPTVSSATLAQMRAYQGRLNQYLAAAGKQLTCLSQVREASAVPLRDTLVRQLHSMVENFKAEARVVEARAQAQADARALQAQQTRRRQAQALAAQVFAACVAPPDSQPPGALTAQDAASFRRQLVGYQAAVRSYIACLRQADLAAAAPDRGLANDQRAQLAQTAMHLGDAAIQSFNQVASNFNIQVPRLRQHALAAQAQAQHNLAEALVRGTAIFPDSSWSVPAPLPADQCFRITQSGRTYQVQICHSTYVTALGVSTQAARSFGGLIAATAHDGITLPGDAGLALATQQESIAARHGVAGDPRGGPPILGIAVAPNSQAGQQTGTRTQTVLYSVSDLHIAGRHLSLIISRRSPGATSIEDESAMHLDLALSADNQTLHGYCWTDQQRSACTLTRHTGGSVSKNSTH